MKRMSEHTGLISSYQLLITAACTNTGGKMKGSYSRAADRCPFVPRHSLSQVTSFMQLGMLWDNFLCVKVIGHILDTIVHIYYTTKLLWGYTGFTPSVRPSRMPCPLCIIYSYEWILFILGTNDHYHERVCRTPWPLTLTYIFKVIWPWLRKSCPLCSVYSSE